MSRSRMHAAVGGFLAAAVFLAACSGDDADGDGGSSPDADVDLSLLGPPEPAAGDPVTVGFITDGRSVAIDSSDEAESAQAAADYVNEHLGGIAGRPLELLVCETQVTPAGATDCANQMIAAEVPIVLQVAPGVPGPIVSGLGDADIPYFVQAAIDQEVVVSPNAYVLTNTLGGLAAPVKVAQDLGVDNVAAILIDLPAAVGPIEALGQPLFDEAGIAIDFVAVPPGTPDMTPQMQDVIDSGAELVNIIGDPAFCISALGALDTLGFEGARLVNPQCISPETAQSVPGGVDGVMVATTESLDASDPEVALYEAVMAQFAPDVEPHGSTTPGAYAIVVALARAMTGLTGDVTADSVRTALETADPQPLPLLDGQTFTCDRTLFELTPPVCSSGIAIVTLDAEGHPKDTQVVDTESIING